MSQFISFKVANVQAPSVAVSSLNHIIIYCSQVDSIGFIPGPFQLFMQCTVTPFFCVCIIAERACMGGDYIIAIYATIIILYTKMIWTRCGLPPEVDMIRRTAAVENSNIVPRLRQQLAI